jgi:MscS family membrane protein
MWNVLNSETLGQTFSRTTVGDWAFLLVCILAGLLLGKVLQKTISAVGDKAHARGWKMRGATFRSAERPAAIAIFTFFLSMGLSAVFMAPTLRLFCGRVLTLFYICSIGWFLYDLIDLVDLGLRQLTRSSSNLDNQLAPLLCRALRIFLIVLLVLFTADNVFNQDITAWLAGLGIAGLGVSLAAQDSIKNLFGSLTIFLDHPFGVGDRIVVGGQDGVVESIGFRSTKMRTLTGHQVTIPNSQIVDTSVENIQRRPYLRRILNITVTYDTSPQKLERAIQIVNEILAEPDIDSAFDRQELPPRVYFNDFNADSLNIQLIYWFKPPDWWGFQEHAHRFNMRLLKRYNDEGIEFAFPTRTLILSSDEKRKLSMRLLGEADQPNSEAH